MGQNYSRDKTRRGGALPYVSQYHLPVKRPPFWCKSYTQWPCLSLQSTPNDPLFSKFQRKIFNFSCAFRNFCKFSAKNGKFSLKFDPINIERPTILGSLHLKRPNGPIFFDSTPNDPLFSTISYTECPVSFSGRQIHVTFTSECPPPPG